MLLRLILQPRKAQRRFLRDVHGTEDTRIGCKFYNRRAIIVARCLINLTTGINIRLIDCRINGYRSSGMDIQFGNVTFRIL